MCIYVGKNYELLSESDGEGDHGGFCESKGYGDITQKSPSPSPPPFSPLTPAKTTMVSILVNCGMQAVISILAYCTLVEVEG